MAYRNDITADYVRSILDYAAETGDLIWKWRPDKSPNINARWVGKKAGQLTPQGRLAIRIDGVLYLAHRLIWLHVTGDWPAYQLDHKDLNPLNNRFDNLREADDSSNMCNRKARNATGVKGVYFVKAKGKWGSQITKSGKHYWLGLHDTREGAVSAREKAALELHGEFARTG